MKGIFSVKDAGKWWKGEVTMRYNLLLLGKLLGLLIALPFILLFYLGKGLWAGLVWVAKHVLKPVFFWLAVGLTALWMWLRARFERKSAPKDVQPETTEPYVPQPKDDRWMWIVLALAFLVALVALWRSCSSAPETLTDEPAVVYDRAFDEVIVARAYLDGVQKEVSGECPRALVGFKFINNRPVEKYNFDGLTYEEAVKVVAEDWKPLVTDNLNPEVRLSSQQMAVVTLAAMRMGKYGFARSTFLKKVNEGDFASAGEWLLLQKSDGSVRETGDEPKQYFYILRLLWNGDLAIRDLLDFPMFSYKGIDISSVYTVEGEYIFNPKIENRLMRGNFATPREALELY